MLTTFDGSLTSVGSSGDMANTRSDFQESSPLCEYVDDVVYSASVEDAIVTTISLDYLDVGVVFQDFVENMSKNNSDFYARCHRVQAMLETTIFSGGTDEGIELPSYYTHDLSVKEELGDVDLCPSDVDLHNDIE